MTACDPDHAADVRADLLLALLRRGPRTYHELRHAGFDGTALGAAAEAIERDGRGRVLMGPWVELRPLPPRALCQAA